MAESEAGERTISWDLPLVLKFDWKERADSIYSIEPAGTTDSEQDHRGGFAKQSSGVEKELQRLTPFGCF